MQPGGGKPGPDVIRMLNLIAQCRCPAPGADPTLVRARLFGAMRDAGLSEETAGRLLLHLIDHEEGPAP